VVVVVVVVMALKVVELVVLEDLALLFCDTLQGSQ
jgi:hypothetical protein